MQEEVIVKFAKLREGAVIPTKLDEDVGFDLYACFDEEYIKVSPGKTVKIPLGIAAVLPSDKGVVLKQRSSTGSYTVSLGAGVVDSGYRGEWSLYLSNNRKMGDIYITKSLEAIENEYDKNVDLAHMYNKGICQGVLVQTYKLKSVEVPYEEVQNTDSIRGLGTEGSSGK